MASSHGMPVKMPQVVIDTLDSEGSGSDAESGRGGGLESEVDFVDDLIDVKQEIEELDEEQEANLKDDTEDKLQNYDSSVEIKEEKESNVHTSEIKDHDIKSESIPAEESVRTIRVMENPSDESELESDNENSMEDNRSNEGDLNDSDDYGGDASEDDVGSDGDNDKEGGSAGLAKVMAKILATKNSKSILSKAKKNRKITDLTDNLHNDDFEIVDSTGKIRKEPKIKVEKEDKVANDTLHNRELQKKIWENRFRVKPDVKEDWEKERRLRVLATQGVVQLFSAIEKHKNMVQRKLSETRSITLREKVLETTGKEAFLEILQQQRKVTLPNEEESVKEEIKDEPVELPSKKKPRSEIKDEPVDVPPVKKPRWGVLADNFYKEPTLQGWDQQSDDDN